MARKRARKKHAVKAELRVPGLSKAGSSLKLEIYASKLKLGEVTVGRGSLFGVGGIAKSGSASHGRASPR